MFAFIIFVCFYDSLYQRMTYNIFAGKVATPVLFDVLAKEGNIPERDMFNTFNMGVGMILTVAAEDADKAIEILKANGEDAYRLGVIGEGSGVQLV